MITIDVVVGIFQQDVPLHDPDPFIENVERLLLHARNVGDHVFHARQLTSAGTRFALDASTRRFHTRASPQPGERSIPTHRFDAFDSTSLATDLRELGVTEVVICGFATELAVDTTVRSAFTHGFSAFLASDAHTTINGAVLGARDTISHHNWVLRNFATVRPARELCG